MNPELLEWLWVALQPFQPPPTPTVRLMHKSALLIQTNEDGKDLSKHVKKVIWPSRLAGCSVWRLLWPL